MIARITVQALRRNCRIAHRHRIMNTTRRHPRTMQEAFGPYTNHHIDEPLRSLSPWELTLIPTVVAIASALLMLWAGQIRPIVPATSANGEGALTACAAATTPKVPSDPCT